MLTRKQTHVYNEAYAPLLGTIHPCQGQKPSVALAEIWAHFDKIIADGHESGQALVGERQFLLLLRHGLQEETYFSWKFIPIIGEEGFVVANYVTVTEVTQEVLVDRRIKTIHRVGQHLANASNLTEVWAYLLTGLEENGKDLPLVILYSVRKTATTACVLEGTLGLPAGHEIAPDCMDLENGSQILVKLFRDCRTKDGPLLLQVEDGSLPADLFGQLDWRGFGIPSNHVVACPIRSRATGTIMAFLLIALNPRRQYDKDYQTFLDLLTKEITTSHVSTMLLAEEIMQRQNASEQASMERAQLSEQLLARTAEYEQIEADFFHFANRVNVGFTILDLEGRVLYANDVWRRMFSVPRGNWEPRLWLNAIVLEDRNGILRAWQDLCMGKEAISKLIRLYVSLNVGTEDAKITEARYRTCLFDAYPDLDENGQVKSIMACVFDISKLKHSEEQVQVRTRELEHSELKYRHFAENAPVGVSLINCAGLIEFANEAWLSITGQSETKYTSWLRSFHHEDVSMLQSLFFDLMASKKPFTVESRVQRCYNAEDSRTHSPERPAWILVSAHPELNNSGALENVVCWLTDISDQKSAERDLRARMDEALEMKRQQENFIDMISHEIRNPLSAQLHCAEEIMSLANGFLKAIASTASSESLDSVWTSASLEDLLGNAKEAARIIAACVHHQKRIVDDVLTMSKLDSNLLAISPTPVQPVKLAQEAFKMFEGEIKAADITLTFEEDASIQDLGVDWVNLDPGRVLQILINLAGNSLKFTRDAPRRKITVSVSASVKKPSTLDDDDVEYFPQSKGRKDSHVAPMPESTLGENLYVSWTVHDTGRGISPEEKRMLFQRFSQASPRTHSKYGGSGLGLFISRQLTEMQGGKIGVISERGKGSKFIFFVKGVRAYPKSIFARPQSAPDGRISELTLQSTLAPAHTRNPSQSLAKVKILVVEDNLVNQKVLTRQLRNRGYTVDVANDGREALEALQGLAAAKGDKGERSVDLVLMDLEMPVMNGIAAIGEIRKLEVSGGLQGHVPVIACTASVRDVEAALDAGMVGFGLSQSKFYFG